MGTCRPGPRCHLVLRGGASCWSVWAPRTGMPATRVALGRDQLETGFDDEPEGRLSLVAIEQADDRRVLFRESKG